MKVGDNESQDQAEVHLCGLLHPDPSKVCFCTWCVSASSFAERVPNPPKWVPQDRPVRLPRPSDTITGDMPGTHLWPLKHAPGACPAI